MRLRSKDAVPDHHRRAFRLGVAVLLLASVGFSLIGRGHDGAVMLAKWACLTAPVVTMPYLGKTSQVGFERLLGTVVGGLLGYFTTALATNWWTLQATETDDIFLAVAAAGASALAVLAGKRWDLDLSAKLFVIAFVLVAFSSQQGQDPRQVAATRIGGIALGVLTMMLMSVLILPKSATIESLRTLRKSLQKLRDVNAATWGSHLQQQPAQQAGLEAAGEGSGATTSGGGGGGSGKQAAANGGGCITDSAALLEPLLPPVEVADGPDLEVGRLWNIAREGVAAAEGAGGDSEEDAHMLQSERALTELYQLLDKVAEQLTLARNEVWLGNWGGRPIMLPGLWPRRQAAHLPWKELEAMADAVRRVARLLLTALLTLQGGFDRQLREVLGPLYPEGLLPSLATGADAAIQELHAAFPCEPRAPSAGLGAFSASVLSLMDMSDEHRRQVVHAMRRYRNRSSARASWSRLIDAALQQPAGQQPGGQQLAAAEAAAEGEGSQQFGTPASAAASPASMAASPAASAARALPAEPVAAEAAAPGAGDTPQEAVRANWLQRMSSGLLGGPAAVAVASAVDAASSSASEAGNERGLVSPLRSAAVRQQRRGLSAALDSPPETEALGEQAAVAAEVQQPQQQQQTTATTPSASPAPAARPPRTPSAAGANPAARPGSAAGEASYSAGGVGGNGLPATPLSLFSRMEAMRESALTVPLLLFPDSTEGRLAQVSWYSFQGVCEELVEQLAGLAAAVDAVLQRLPA